MDVLRRFLHLSRMKGMTLAEVAAAGNLRVNLTPGIVRCEPMWELKPYRLTDFLIWCVLDGLGVGQFQDGVIPLRPGTCLLLKPGQALGAVQEPNRQLRVFYLHADILDAEGNPLTGELVGLPTLPVMMGDLAGFESLARQVIEGHTAGGETGRLRCDLALRLVLLQLHGAAQQHPGRSDLGKLTAVLLAVKENPGHLWTVPEIAAQAGLSVAQAARRIRELTGCSPREFIIRARIERARRLMEESSLSLKQIAETLGYSDVYFFHRQFKSVTGQTPGQWRRAS